MSDDVIDDIIDEIEDESEIDYYYDEEETDLIVSKEKELEIDLDEKHSLANKIVENSLDVINQAGVVFQSFKDDVLLGKDRSTSSKEMLIKALEVQNSANKNLIDLNKALNGDNKGNTNILIQSAISHKKTGVNPNNLKNFYKD